MNADYGKRISEELLETTVLFHHSYFKELGVKDNGRVVPLKLHLQGMQIDSHNLTEEGNLRFCRQRKDSKRVLRVRIPRDDSSWLRNLKKENRMMAEEQGKMLMDATHQLLRLVYENEKGKKAGKRKNAEAFISGAKIAWNAGETIVMTQKAFAYSGQPMAAVAFQTVKDGRLSKVSLLKESITNAVVHIPLRLYFFQSKSDPDMYGVKAVFTKDLVLLEKGRPMKVDTNLFLVNKKGKSIEGDDPDEVAKAALAERGEMLEEKKSVYDVDDEPLPGGKRKWDEEPTPVKKPRLG